MNHCFNTDINVFFIIIEHQINRLDWFLKDRVTLKIGVMTAENTKKKYILKYNAVILKCYNFVLLLLLYCYVDYPTNATFGEHKTSFKTLKSLILNKFLSWKKVKESDSQRTVSTTSIAMIE